MPGLLLLAANAQSLSEDLPVPREKVVPAGLVPRAAGLRTQQGTRLAWSRLLLVRGQRWCGTISSSDVHLLLSDG